MKGVIGFLALLTSCTVSEGDILLRRSLPPDFADLSVPGDLSRADDMAEADDLPPGCASGVLGPGLGCLGRDVWGRIAIKQCVSLGELTLLGYEPQDPCGVEVYQRMHYVCCR